MTTRRVLELLVDIRTLLAEHHVDKWVGDLDHIRCRLDQAISSADTKVVLAALVQIRQLYSGMGSFNDIFITDQAGHVIEPNDIDRVNSRLQRLQEELFVAVTREIAQFRSGASS